MTSSAAQSSTEALEAFAEALLNKYSCVIGTYDNFHMANTLHTDAWQLLNEGFIDALDEETYISQCEANIYYQERIAAGEAELVSIGIPEWMDPEMFPGIDGNVDPHIPLEQVECFMACKDTLPGYATFVPGEFTSVCWNLANPIRLKNENKTNPDVCKDDVHPNVCR